MSAPPITLDSNQVIFESTGDDKVLLSYVLLGRKYFTDPYYHPSGVTQQLSESVTVPMDAYNDTLVAIFRYPCMYSTNIYVYEYSDNYIEKTDEYTFDALYDCPSGTLLSINIHNSYDKQTGADLNSSSGLNNTCDPPYKAEYYRTLSLGNAKGYIDVQEQCCEYCREAQEDGKVRFFANPNCFSLDIEATSSSIDHFKQAGNCKIDERNPCNNAVIMGRAKLNAIVRFTAEIPSDALIVEGEFEPSGFIMFYSSGYLNNEANIIGSGYNMIVGEVSAMTTELIAYFEGYTV